MTPNLERIFDEPRRKRVIVLLSTFNGQQYLVEQLDSLLAQHSVELEILVRDDGSTDSTIEILSHYQGRNLLRFVAGPNVGPARSFLALTQLAGDADYYALCDQDDVWDSDKLSIAIDLLSQMDPSRPHLYHSAVRLVDERLETLEGRSGRSFFTPPNLLSALVLNSAAGCTMVFNRALLELVRTSRSVQPSMHDAWILRVCMACGGGVISDRDPHLSYRQHANNAIGGAHTLIGRANRRFETLRTRQRLRENDALNILECYGDSLSEENRDVVGHVAYYRRSLRNTLALLFSPKLRFPSLEHRLSFIVGVFSHSL